jgi:crotonobetainyl-CoA:carnitine CoA-transferase CaiB-like acyl-CoA transferase
MKARACAVPGNLPAVDRLPLSGFRVVDLTVDRGELCGRLLADFGADVVKVEPPGGSPARGLAPRHGDLGLFWAMRNASKRGVVLDLEQAEGVERLHQLLACSDAVVLSGPPTNPALDPSTLEDRHPHLVVTVISPYGLTGAWRDRVATDGVLAATGTIAYKAGVPTKDPLLPPSLFVDDGTSVTFAYATLCALWQRRSNGAGQVVDCSVNEAIANMGDWTMPGTMARVYSGEEGVREIRNGAGPVWPSFRCADGFVRVVILSARQWHAMREWLGEPEYLQDPDLDTFPGRLAIADAVINPLIEALFADRTMDDISAEAQERGIVCTPLALPADVLRNEHFRVRGSLVELDLGGGVRGPIPSGFVELDGERAGPKVGPPTLGQHTDEVFASLDDQRPAPTAAPETALPLAGLRVADFGHGGVGVEVGRMFAEYGADVIKIESRSYPDFIRAITGAEMSPSFASSSRSKRGFGANAKTAEGHEVLLRLLEQCDVVIENNSTGVMAELGLDYDSIRKVNPGIVMVSSQLMGSRGPWADFRGYGPSTRAAGGIEMLWNYDDQDEPAGGMSIFPDHLCGRVGALAALAGLLGREHGDGTGVHVEMAQVEVTVGIVGDLLTKEALEPGTVRAIGNRSPRGVPWGLFRCTGDEQWAAITVRDDRDWAALVEVMGDPAWATASDLATADGRQARIDEIEDGVRAWTASLSREDVVARCQGAGIPAGEMLTSLESVDNEQYLSRGFRVEIEQPGNLVPKLVLDGPGFYGSRMAVPVIEPAPLVGEHTREICRDLLGMPDDEIEQLISAGALEVTPPAV